jgi:hypothetical protein
VPSFLSNSQQQKDAPARNTSRPFVWPTDRTAQLARHVSTRLDTTRADAAAEALSWVTEALGGVAEALGGVTEALGATAEALNAAISLFSLALNEWVLII